MKFSALAVATLTFALTLTFSANSSVEAKDKPHANKAPKAAKTQASKPAKAAKAQKAAKTAKVAKVAKAAKNAKPAKTSAQGVGKLSQATKNNPAHHESQAKSNQQLFHAFHVLQSTKLLLEKGNHDYGGNRAAAVSSIGASQNRLRAALGDYGMKIPPAPAGNVKGGKQSQAASNAQLRTALKTIDTTITQLQNANHDYYGQRAAAVRDLRATRRQLEAALKFAPN